MGFPQTRLTLIQRLAAEGNEQDWRAFHDDYWIAVCRFAVRWRGLSIDDAEDVAAETFQAVLTNNLLVRWQANRSAKLRTLLCGVAKNIMANRGRVADGRQRILHELAAQGDLPTSVWPSAEPSVEQADAFYAAWVDDLLQRAVDTLLRTLHREGKGDYFRVLYGRVCEQLAMREVADLLGISVATAENYFKAARKRLAGELESAVRRHVQKYSEDAVVAEEFSLEWQCLSDHLSQHGGLENVLRAHHQAANALSEPSRTSARYRAAGAAMRRAAPQ